MINIGFGEEIDIIEMKIRTLSGNLQCTFIQLNIHVVCSFAYLLACKDIPTVPLGALC